MRCCSYLVSGAEDEARDADRERVVWLANEYLRYHDQAVDAAAWEEWKRETIPDAVLSAEHEGGSGAGAASLVASRVDAGGVPPLARRRQRGLAQRQPLLAAPLRTPRAR